MTQMTPTQDKTIGQRLTGCESRLDNQFLRLTELEGRCADLHASVELYKGNTQENNDDLCKLERAIELLQTQLARHEKGLTDHEERLKIHIKHICDMQRRLALLECRKGDEPQPFDITASDATAKAFRRGRKYQWEVIREWLARSSPQEEVCHGTPDPDPA